MFKAIQILKLWFIINFMKKRNIQIDISYIMLIEYFFLGGGGAEHKVRAWMERQFFGVFFLRRIVLLSCIFPFSESKN